MSRAALALLVLCAVAALGSEVPQRRTLVLTDNMGIRSSHSRFFKNLEDMGHTLKFASADEGPQLKEYGEYIYDNIVLFAPTTDLSGGVDVSSLLAFVDAGKNMIVGAGDAISDSVRELANECGVDFDEEGTTVIDHVNFIESDAEGEHRIFLTDNYSKVQIIMGDKLKKPVLFSGVGMAVEEDNILITKLLSGTEFTYAANPSEPIKTYPASAGKDTTLVAALQARNSARVVFSGSIDMFSDRYFTEAVSRNVDAVKFTTPDNELFSTELCHWAFQHRGVLRYSDVTHHKVGETVAPRTYVVKDMVFYSITLSELVGDKWVPYKANDVQLEFVMMDPKIRTTVAPNKKGVYEWTFMAPDTYGVYTFRMVYQRPGYSFLTSATTAPVRPYMHNEFERFIPMAYPYYVSAFGIMASVVVFSFFFLYSSK